MSDVSSLFDVYSLRARVFPALLVVLPVGIALGLLLPTLDYQKLVVAGAVSAGVPILMANLVRARGKRLEDRLVEQWDGLPTTRLLRLREPSNDRPGLSRRRELLEKVTQVRLPTPIQEQDDPAEADHTYVMATRALIARVREDKDHHALVQHENIDYGFRRNLLAIKPIALTVLVILLAVDGVAALAGMGTVPVAAAAAVHLGFLAAWLAGVRRRWVRGQAESYAQALFWALEAPGLYSPGTAGKS